MNARIHWVAFVCAIAIPLSAARAQPGSVEIRAPKAGALASIHFVGELVKKGDLLFQLDPRPQKLALAEAEAEYARAERARRQTEAELKRADALLKANAIGVVEHAKIAGAHMEAQLTLKVRRIDMERARLHLESMTIHAPSAGVISKPRVSLGELVRASDTLLATIAPIDGGESAYGFTLRKPADAIAVVKEKERTAFVVTCASGIGDGVIRLKGGQWPEKVTLHFQHADQNGFTNLEKLTLTTERIRIEGNLQSTGKFRFCFLDAKETPAVIEPGAREPAGFLNVTVEKRAGGLEVTLPAHLLLGAQRVELSWIDAFR